MIVNNKRIENSIRGLVNLYTVIIGVSLSIAVSRVVDPTNGLSAATPTSVVLFISFVVTLFPFVHGALRHLDDAYLENPNKHIRKGALIFDFGLLFLHALALLVLSLLLTKPNHFAWCLVVLLAVDSVWGVFVHYGASSDSTDHPELRWAGINFLFVVTVGAYLVSQGIFLDHPSDTFGLAILILSATLIRSAVDYIACANFYFPD